MRKMRKKEKKKDMFSKSELLQIVRTAQKGLYVGKYEVLSGEASRKRRLSGYYFSAEGCKAAFNNRPL
ncbi:hypothetical protein, partial [Anaerotignum lactatifermentans]